jgi:hypothetical protein
MPLVLAALVAVALALREVLVVQPHLTFIPLPEERAGQLRLCLLQLEVLVVLV